MRKFVMMAVMGGLSTLSAGVYAEGHYVPGVEGVKVSTVPPAGNYYLGYFVDYEVDKLKAPGSDQTIPGRNKGTVTALANRFVHMTKQKFLGADYGVELIVPLVDKDFKFDAAAYNNSKSGVADVYVGPLVLGWHGNRWDAAAAAGVWLDNADSNELASPGNGYQSTMLTAGATTYLNADKSASASALMRYEMHGKNDAGFEPGDQISLEWGLGKTVRQGLDLGLVGYEQWQVTKDKGTGASNDKSSKHAIGVEGSYLVKPLKGIVKAAYYNEYNVEAGTGPAPAGNTLRLTFVKPF